MALSKALLDKATVALASLNYRKHGASFWRIEDDFYRLVGFQSGAHGDYFFINICIHPIGLPKLRTGEVVIPERPKEYECIVRQRLEQTVSNEATQRFRKGLVFANDDAAVDAIIGCIPTDAERWIHQWASHAAMADAPEAVLDPMLTVVPLLKAKAGTMLKCFCFLKMGKLDSARECFAKCLAAPTGGYDFSHVDNYLQSLLDTAVL